MSLFTAVIIEEQKAIDLREKSLKKTRVPTAQKIRQWYNKHKNCLNLKQNVGITDKRLETFIKLFENKKKKKKKKKKKNKVEMM